MNGNRVDNSGLIPFDQAYFAFEVESVLGTLKEVPIWDELEQMLDNPYAFALAPEVKGNFQGWPSYRVTQARRRSFIYRNAAGQPCAPLSPGCSEVPLPGHVIHPPNYNYQGGEELRLLNIDFQGANWLVPRECVDPETNAWTCTTQTLPNGQARYTYLYDPVTVSPGASRIEPDEAKIDYNSPMRPQQEVCVTTVEPIPPPEGSLLCGHDPGEPGYAGFGVLLNGAARRQQYSVPAVPGGTVSGDFDNGLKSSIVGLPLFDPARGFIRARNESQPIGGLRRPSLRAEGQLAQAGGGRIHNGNPNNPDYLINSAANLAADPAALLPSNENDYYGGATRAQKVAARNAAAALGKALFWDMQVGSDSVQACASCHFHAGVDNRTKGQINSGVNAGDTTLITVANTINGTAAGQNAEVTVNSFPLHKLADPFTPSDPLNPNGNAIVRTTNDVLSSMGVSRFKLFADVPVGPTAFLPAGAGGVASLRPDYACGDAAGPGAGCLAPPDPVVINQGFRRIEPRHTPTFFAATLNFDNFWDGRARHDFNGGSVFGAADPQAHVMVNNAGTLVATRQMIRFASLASLATGPALSEFEMSFADRNWAKLGKRLLQSGVTPLANQLVDPNDSVLGPYSNNRAAGPGCPTCAVGKPGLNRSYSQLIQAAFYPNLWNNTTQHLNGCYTDDLVKFPQFATLHPNQCNTAAGGNVAVAIPVLSNGQVVNSSVDPFDNYVLSLDTSGPANPLNTNQFTQMEANFSLFFGLALHAWGTILMPDDTPFDRFMDANPDAFVAFGEANENALVIDLPMCGQNIPGGLQQGTACLTEVGNFKRDSGVFGKFDCPGPEGANGCRVIQSGGSRTGGVDPLLGLDFFLGSNLSLKNPNYNTLRCGECHQGGTLTDMTVEVSHQLSFNDWAQEFSIGSPGSEIFPEPLGRSRIIAGFALESEINGVAQDAVERNIADLCTIEPCQDVYGGPIPGGAAGGFPQGQALFDNGVYNIGVTPIADDVGRGGNDAFGWPLSLARLALKNICGVAYTPGGDTPGAPGSPQFPQPGGGGNVCPTFNPSIDPTGGGVFSETAQDQQINPGFEEELEPGVAQLPPYLAPFANNINVGDEVQIDEVFTGLNTIMREPMKEGFIDSFGQFNPSAVLGENMNNAVGDQMATWPNVNRVNVQGAFKAAPLRNIELTNPYFHDGGNLTLRQQLDFYTRGGNFPITNKAHRDFLAMNLKVEDEALGAYAVPSTVVPICDPTAPLGSAARTGCVGVAPGTAGAVPFFSEAQKEEIIVSVVDFLLELTDERVKYERAPFDHPEVFVPLDATAPENGVLMTTTGNRAGLLANTTGVCRDSTTGQPFPGATAPCFRQVPAVGAGGNTTPLPNFLGISSGPRLVGGSAFCSTVNNHYCH